MNYYKPIIKTVVVASLATATAFFCVKLVKEYKKVAKEEAERKAINDATVKKTTKDPEPKTEEEDTTEDIAKGSDLDKPFSVNEEDRYSGDEIKVDYNDLDPEDRPETGHDEPDTIKPKKAKKVEKLRYDPNSKEALEQYHSMLLANFDDHSGTYRLVRRMFDVEVQLGTETDPRATLWSNIQDMRIEFFGHNDVVDKMPTLGEIFVYLSTKADYDMGLGQEYWCSYWLQLNHIFEPISAYDLKSFGKSIEDNNIEEAKDGVTYIGLFHLAIEDMEDCPEGIIEQYWDFMTVRLNSENQEMDDSEIDNDLDDGF